MTQTAFEGKVLEKLEHIEKIQKKQGEDIETLNKKAAMGEGALWLFLKIGTIVGGITALVYLISIFKEGT